MAQIHPHINFNGNAEKAFLFYQSIFGGEFTKVIRFKDLASAEFQVPENEAEKIMHIELPIGQSKLMANDVPEFMGPTNERENRSKIVVQTQSIEEANQIFNELSIEGEVEMPLEHSPWSTYFGMLRDQYGIEWMVEFDSTNHK
ncbi:VOC family protein [Aquirufa sp. ROCK2-A2]